MLEVIGGVEIMFYKKNWWLWKNEEMKWMSSKIAFSWLPICVNASEEFKKLYGQTLYICMYLDKYIYLLYLSKYSKLSHINVYNYALII